ncbi:MAG: hypothetical protein ACR2LN_06020 [Candidatus Levyibacteriota bacterium]
MRPLGILTFLMKNKIIFACGLFLLFFIFVLLYSLFASRSAKNSSTPIPHPAPVHTQAYPTQVYKNDETGQKSVTNALIEGEPMKNGWVPMTFTEESIQGTAYTKSTTPDGSVQYTVPSINQARPNEIVTKDNTIVFQRALISGKTIDDYIASLGQPEYTYNESSYYGDDILVYLYLKKGIAIVAGPMTRLVFEQITFQPMSIDEFKSKYGADLTDQLK